MGRSRYEKCRLARRRGFGPDSQPSLQFPSMRAAKLSGIWHDASVDEEEEARPTSLPLYTITELVLSALV